MKIRKSYLDCFPNSENYITDYTWYNGEHGTMVLETAKDDLQVDEYFFGFANMTGEEKKRIIRIWESRGKLTGRPILFGIAAYWILRHTISSITSLYEDYLRDKIEAYKRKYEKKVSSRKRNIKLDFYANYIVPEEIKKNQMSEEIFDYITPEDAKQLKEVMEDFIEYLKEKRTEMGYVDNPQLNVLRYLDSGDKSVLENMPDYEFNTICDELGKGGYITVNWVEGHVPEDAKLLDKGKTYMAQLEKEGAAKKSKETNVLQTESNCPKDNLEDNDEHQFLSAIENKPILALTWRLMQLDGATIKGHGDKVIIQKILELITGLPYNSCKKVWEVGNRPITRKADDIAKLNQLMKSIGMNIQL